MSKIISFENIKKMTSNDVRSPLPPFSTTLPTTNINSSSIEDILNAFSDMANIVTSQFKDMNEINEKERRRHKEFEQKYSNILKVVPLSITRRMKCYIAPMVDLVPKMFNGDFKDRFSANNDFSEFYFLFDKCVSQYAEEHPEIEDNYDFQFNGRSILELKRDLTNCLNSILVETSNDNEENGKLLIHLANELFELSELVNDLFSTEIKKRNNLDF